MTLANVLNYLIRMQGPGLAAELPLTAKIEAFADSHYALGHNDSLDLPHCLSSLPHLVASMYA